MAQGRFFKEQISTLSKVGVGTILPTESIETTGNIKLADDGIIKLGDDNDLQILHNGSDSIIKDAGTGNLELHATNLVFRNHADSAQYASFINGGAVSLYYNNILKLSTSASGSTIHGDLTASNLFVSNNAALKANGSGYLELGNTNGGVIQVGGDGGDSTIAPRFNNLKIQTSRDVDDIIFLAGASTTEILRIDASASSIVGSGLVSLTGGGSSSPVGVNGLHLMFDSSGGTAHINAQQNGTSNRHLSFKAASYTFNSGGVTLDNNLTLSYAYPRINLTDTNNDSDYSIINNDGAFSIYDVTNTSHRLSIAANGNATFAETVTGKSFHQDAQVASSFYQATFDSDVTVASSLILHQAGNFNYISSQDASKDLIIRNTGSGKDMVLQVTSSGGTAELFRLRGVNSKEIVSSANFEIRNGTSSRHINLYETYTDSSNYERSFFKHASSFLEIGTEAAGTGTASGIKVRTTGVTALSIAAGGLVTVESRNSSSSNNILSVGGSLNGYMSVRHIEGKSSIANSHGALYLNSLSTHNIFMAAGGGNIFMTTGGGKVGIGTSMLTTDVGGSKLQVDKYTVGSNGNQSVTGTAAIFTDSGSDGLYLGVKNASYPNRGYAFKVTNNGVNSDFTIREHGSTGDRFTIQSGGNVGIGSTSPSSKLHVLSGAVSGYSKDTYADIIVEDSDARIQVVSDNGGTNGSSIILTNVDSGTHSNWAIGQTTTGNSNKLHIGHNTSSGGDTSNFSNTQDLVITTDGKVGIGTTTIPHLLSVKGTISRLNSSGIQVINLGVSSDHGQLTINNSSGVNTVSINATGNSYIAGGNLGVGAAATNTRLEVKGGTSDSLAYGFLVRNSSNTSLFSIRNDGRIDIPVGPVVIDTNTVYVDTTNNRVGIGTTSPASILDVNGGSANGVKIQAANAATEYVLSATTSNGTSRLWVGGTGNVGIGTTSPASPLSVVGSARIDGSSGDGVLTIANSAGSQSLRFDQNSIRTTTNNNLTFLTNGNSNSLVLEQANNRVGVGISGPQSKFHVSGGDIRIDNNQQYLAETAGGGVIGVAKMDGSDNLLIGDGNLKIDVTGTTARLIIDSSGNTTLAGDLTVQGDISSTGTFTIIDTDVSTTEQLLVTNDGTGPAAVINQKGVQPIVDFQDDSTSVFYIKNGGNVGLGTTTPAQKLHIHDGHLRLNDTYKIEWGGSDARIDGSHSSDYLRFFTSNTERIRIVDGGNVGIGTTSPATTLQVSKVDATSAITIHRDGSNPSTNTSLGKIIFAQDYNGTQQNSWGQIELKTNASSTRTDMNLKVKSTSGNEMTAMTLHGTSSDGPRVGIGTTSPAAKLDIVDSQTQSGAGRATIQTTATTTTTSTQSSGMYAIQNYFNLTGASGSFQNAAHQQVLTTVSSTGTATNLKNHMSRVHTSGSGQINNVSHYNIHTELEGSGTISNWMGYAVADGTLATFTNSGHTITNTYGLYIGDITSGTQTNTPFGVYQANTDMRNYFGGNVGIGTASPSSMSSSNARRLVVGSGSGAEGITIYSGNTNGGYLYFADGTSGDASYRGAIQYSHSTDALSLHTAGTTTRMIVTNGGLVGIGVTNPQVQFFNNLVVGDNLSGDKGITIRSNNAARGVLAFSDTDAADSGRYAGFISYNHSDNSMRFHTLAGNEHLTILSGGNVGVGNNNPTQAKLQVSGGSVLIDAYNATGTHGLFFRSGFVSSNQYNLSITCHNDGDGSPDALDINAFDGIYFNTGAGTRNNRAFINSSGKFCINQGDTSSDFLQVTGASGLYAARFNGSATGGNSWGLRVRAGTNENDINFLAENTSGVDLFRINGNGKVGIGNVNPTSKLHIFSGAFSSGEGEIRNDARVNRSYKLALGTTTKYIGTVQMNGNGDSSGFHVRIYDGHSKVWREVNVVVQNDGGTNNTKVIVEGGGDDVNINVEFAYVNRSGAAQKTDFYLVPTSSKAYTQLIFVDGFIERDTGHSSTSSTNINLDTAVGIYKAATDDSSRIGIGTNNPSEKLHVLGNAVITGSLDVQSQIIAPNAPTNLNLSVVGETINVTFTASNTPNISAYLVYSSVDGGDYGLISIIPPDDFASTMSIIDSAFTVTGTQAYRVYAIKSGKMSSALTGSISYTVSSAEPTNLSVVPMNNAFYIQYDPPSSNSRFVTAYKIFKHEHSNQGSLSRSSATEIYSGMNKSYMYQISGANNTNFHQFWVETTIAT